MTKIHQLTRFSVLFLLMLFACEGSGTASGISQTCNSSNTAGSCEIKIGTLKGTYFSSIQNNGVGLGPQQVQANLSVSVGQGTVRVYIRDGKDQETSTLVKAGQTAQLRGLAALSSAKPRSFNIYMEVQGDSASDVQVKVDYQVAE